MASRFWVGGTGTWDASDTTHWSATTGGAGGASVPGVADTVTFDASSGGGTVTVGASYSPSMSALTFGAFTGTLDFSVNNNNVTISGAMSGTGTGARTFKMGNGTWTLSGSSSVWNMTTVTNLTFDAGTSTILLTNTAATIRSFVGGGLTYATLTINANSSGGSTAITGGNTFANLNIAAPNAVSFVGGTTTTITNAFTWTGSSGSMILIFSATASSTATISVATGAPAITWGGIRDMTFQGGASFSALNSADLGHNSGITITAPSGGGGAVTGRVIGG